MELLSRLYNDPSTGFVGKDKLYRQAKAIDSKITRKQVSDFFEQNVVEQVHRKRKKSEKGQPIRGPLNSIQMDLIFYPYPKQNDGYNTILTAVGINNRIGYAIPMKGKTATEAARAIEELIKQAKKKGHPFYLVESDSGSEFINQMVQKVLAKDDINHITGQEGDHNWNGKIERFNRTIKAMISKYMTANNTTRWIDALPRFVKNYNNSFHRAIQMEPSKVDEAKEKQIMEDQTLQALTRISEVDINPGDKVRLPNKRGTFEKEGQNYSNEVYTVDKIGWARLTVKKEDGTPIKKNYKISEVLKVPKNSKSIQTESIKSAKKDAQVKQRVRKEGVEINTEPRTYSARKSKLAAYARGLTS